MDFKYIYVGSVQYMSFIVASYHINHISYKLSLHVYLKIDKCLYSHIMQISCKITLTYEIWDRCYIDMLMQTEPNELVLKTNFLLFKYHQIFDYVILFLYGNIIINYGVINDAKGIDSLLASHIESYSWF